ncbi:septum site-determining protein Ssd [Kocuria sp.]|uniref:septum site-determining protein Ssd n=1 Tax=Kocuria sp. TaxID=1871328 RepID=UPI0026DFFC69|nr:septum site-determining protein Ssd [Kocuria sp.]MDO5618567.1 hypothetical protein [Kocuria sp.]
MNTATSTGRRARAAHTALPWHPEHSSTPGTEARPGVGDELATGNGRDVQAGGPVEENCTADLLWAHDPSWTHRGFRGGEVVDGDGLRVGLVTHDSAVREMVSGICASAGASLYVAATAGGLTGTDVQLLDVQALTDGPATRGGGGDVVLLGRPEDDGLWDAAALLGGCPVAVLPAAESWLADRLAPRTETAQTSQAVVVGVVGAVGGVGASTLACWLAADAAAGGAQTVLVDADPDSCGVDVLLGLESLEAMRWPDLSRSRGVLRGEQLLPLLPGHPDQPGLSWLSWDRESVQRHDFPGVSVLAALRTVSHAVVVDLGRIGSGRDSLAGQCDVVVVALPRTVRGVLAAHRSATALGPVPVEFVLCGVDVADIDHSLVGDALGREPLGAVRFDGRVPEAAESGRLLERGRKRPHQQCVAALWDQLTDRLAGSVELTYGGNGS